MAIRRPTKSKFWCFTVNDSPEEFRINLENLFEEKKDHITFICGQLEEASRRHFQGYLQCKVSRALSWLKNNVSRTAHFEIARGTGDQARAYCHKEDATTVDGTYVECGDFRPHGQGAGARNDLYALRDAVIRGETQREIIGDDNLVETYATYLRFHDRVRSLFKPEPRPNGVRVILYVGEPGTGKTRKAYEEYPDLFEIPVSNGTLWLDGYDDHPNVLFDDFMGRGSRMGLDNALKFFDRYVRQVPVKGGHIWYRPEVIVITSNYHPRHWYDWKDREESWRALCRRFHDIWYFPRDSEPEEQASNSIFLEDHDFWPQIELVNPEF